MHRISVQEHLSPHTRQYNQGKEPSDVYLDPIYMQYFSDLFNTNINKIIEYQEYTKLNNYNKQDKSLPK